MNKYKILALFGKSGAGKDTIQQWIVNNIPNTKGIISCTTRPKRDYERNGVDYHFIEPDEFGRKVLDGTMLEATSFRDWLYGTPIDELEEDIVNIGVFNIQGIECLLEDSRLDVLPVYIDCSDRERLLRNFKRELYPDCKEICRRFLTDDKDFSEINFNYVTFLNGDETRGFYNIHNLPEVKKFING